MSEKTIIAQIVREDINRNNQEMVREDLNRRRFKWQKSIKKQ